MQIRQVLLSFILVSTVNAAEAGTYDNALLVCVDYYHQSISAEKLATCKSEAKDAVMADFKAYQNYLSCVDYHHAEVSAEKDELCLKDAD